MRRIAFSLVVTALAFVLQGCATSYAAPDVRPAPADAPPPLAAPVPAPAAIPDAAPAPSSILHFAAYGDSTGAQSKAGPGTSAVMPDAAIQSATKKARRSASQALAGTASAASAAPASAALVSDLARKRLRDDYIAGLGQGSYSFNPPTPIKVGLPITVALWVDTRKQAAQLAETMKKAYPHSASQVESGTTVWSPKMKAILTGENDITIKPVDGEPFDGIKDVFENSPAKWEWAVTPHSLEPKNLHLKLFVILPPELGGSQDFLVLEREIKVEYRVWWIIDHYWEKYWKWMIGGLASALAASFAWWWKNRQGKS